MILPIDQVTNILQRIEINNLPDELLGKIFSYLNSSEKASNTYVNKQFKTITIKSESLAQSLLFENFIREIKSYIDKKKYPTVIQELNKLISSHPLSKSRSLISLKEELAKMIFPLAEILKEVSYKDLSFDTLHQKVEIPLDFLEKLFIANGLLKLEIFYNQTSDMEDLPEALVSLAETFIYKGYASKGLEIFARAEEASLDLSKTEKEFDIKRAKGQILTALAIKKEFKLIESLLERLENNSFKQDMQSRISLYKKFHSEESDLLIQELDRSYKWYNDNDDLIKKIISSINSLNLAERNEMQEFISGTQEKIELLKSSNRISLIRLKVIIDVLISRNQFYSLSDYIGVEMILRGESLDSNLHLNAILNDEITLDYVNDMSNPCNCFYMITDMITYSFFSKAISLAIQYDQKMQHEQFSMEKEVREACEEAKLLNCGN